MKDLQKQLSRAEHLLSQGHVEKAAQAYAAIYRYGAGNDGVILAYIKFLKRIEDWRKLAQVLEALAAKKKNSAKILSELLRVYLRLNRTDDAEKLLPTLSQLLPETSDLATLRYAVASASGKRQEALNFALEAVKYAPRSVSAYINLGAAFVDMGLREQGAFAFETAHELDPDNVAALTNLGFIAVDQSRVEAGIAYYEAALALAEAGKGNVSVASIKFFLSFPYLYLGDFVRGWDYYEFGFDLSIRASARRSPARRFTKPRWTGQPLDGKTIMVWREQGLGDELRFASCLRHLLDLGANLIVECDPRMVRVFASSFSDSVVRPALWDKTTGLAVYEDFDYQISIGSLPKFFRRRVEDFYPQTAYLKPNARDVEDVKRVFSNMFPVGLKVGICWRSGNLNPLRNRNYSNLADWSAILSTEGCSFVNLQYGDCESELCAAENALGITIHRWSDLNLKDDLDGVFALMSQLDLVITVGTAVAEMAPAIGVETWLMRSKQVWTEHSHHEWLWSPNVRVFKGGGETGLEGPLNDVKSCLLERLAKTSQSP